MTSASRWLYFSSCRPRRRVIPAVTNNVLDSAVPVFGVIGHGGIGHRAVSAAFIVHGEPWKTSVRPRSPRRWSKSKSPHRRCPSRWTTTGAIWNALTIVFPHAKVSGSTSSLVSAVSIGESVGADFRQSRLRACRQNQRQRNRQRHQTREVGTQTSLAERRG